MIGETGPPVHGSGGRGTGAARPRSGRVCERSRSLPGETVKPENLFFAMPNIAGQLVAQNFSKYTQYAAVDLDSGNGAVMQANVPPTHGGGKFSTLCMTCAL